MTRVDVDLVCQCALMYLTRTKLQVFRAKIVLLHDEIEKNSFFTNKLLKMTPALHSKPTVGGLSRVGLAQRVVGHVTAAREPTGHLPRTWPAADR